jgi:viologen exporter family transport system permease protein
VITPELRAYAAVFRVRFALLLQYRAAALAGFITQCWWGAVKVMVFAAFLSGSAASPMTLRQTVDYVWLGQALLMMLPWSADPELARMVRSGDVGYERLRPVDTYAYWYARAVARRTATPLLRAVPMVIMASLVLPALGLGRWGLSAPNNGAAAITFALSLVLVVTLASAFSTLLDVLVVLTLSDRGANTFFAPLAIVFSGSLVPLPLLPNWLQPLLRHQPFAGLMDFPFRIYSGNLAGTAALASLAWQAFWVIALIALGRIVMARVMARLQIQGG